MQPVDPVALQVPDYFTIIKNPMDLGTIRTKLENGEISTEEEYLSLVRLVFDNAILYNKPQDDVAIMANTLSTYFEKEYQQLHRFDSVLDADASTMVTRRRSTKRIGDQLLLSGLRKYSLRGSGFVDAGHKKNSFDLPGDIEPYQYHALEVVMKRLGGSFINHSEKSENDN